MVVLNFLSVAFGTTAAGSFAKHYDVDKAPYYLVAGGTAVLFGLLLAIASPANRKLMSGAR